MRVDSDTFFKLQYKFDSIPFIQSKEWIESNNQSSTFSLLFFLNDKSDVRIGCCAYASTRRLIGRKLVIDGICRKSDVNETELRKFFLSIVEEQYDIITVSDLSTYDPEFELAIRRAGFIRPLGLSLSPMTMYVDLQKPFSFHRNWRRNVKKSVEAGNVFKVIDNPCHEDAAAFVGMFDEQRERKRLRYGFSSNDVICLTTNPKYKMFIVYSASGTPLAGRIVYVSGDISYDVYAANSYNGMKNGAIYHVQEGLLMYLKEKGIETFDYGRIPPRADEMDDIYLAKSYSGGRVVGYNGQWMYCKSLLKQYLLSFRSFYLKKGKLY